LIPPGSSRVFTPEDASVFSKAPEKGRTAMKSKAIVVISIPRPGQNICDIKRNLDQWHKMCEK